MKKIMSATLLSLFATQAMAVKLTDYKPFAFENLFTNPVCATYKYDRPVITNSGKTLTAKPQDVYCKGSDEAASVARSNAPQYRLKEWIGDVNTKEIKMAYLSFSSKNMVAALCAAVKRGVKLTMVLDFGEERKPNADAESLKSCGQAGKVSVTYRGSTGGLGYAHNKIMMVNPNTAVTKVVFSSGNMSSGTSTNHENWNFVTTSGQSYFAQAHNCVIDSMISSGDTVANFGKSLNACRGAIKAQPETDIQVFFSPVDGVKNFANLEKNANQAESVDAMSHRFSGKMARLFSSLLTKKTPIKFILDDDIYWSVKLKQDVGRNMVEEAVKITNELTAKGMKTKYLQTNQNIFQLQHNKFVVLNFANGSGAVFNGAGNFTSAAFDKNFENFYYITIPGVVENYRSQYKKYFNEMATSAEDMPRDYVLP